MSEIIEEPKARTGDGKIVHPGSTVFPILKEIEKKKLSVIGTGFFIARYGLFATAAHVVQDLVKENELGISYVLQVTEPFDGRLYLRKIKRITFFNELDLAVGQADNYVEKFPNDPLTNLRCILSDYIPLRGERVFTYAYPENEIMDFTTDAPPRVVGNRFEGEFLAVEAADRNPFIPYDHFSTSIRVRSGASGGPVFTEAGRVIGVNCRGWDFDGGEHEGDELSSIVPVNI